VGGQGKELEGPSQTPGKLLLFDPWEECLHLLGALGMIDVIDFRNHHRGIAWQFGFNGEAKVDDMSNFHNFLLAALSGCLGKK
jgi:hypothetical protein